MYACTTNKNDSAIALTSYKQLQLHSVYLVDLITKSVNWIEIWVNALDQILHW